MPEQITRQEFLAGLVTVKDLQSVTWRRRRCKFVHCCIHCDNETASHRGERFCNHCGFFVPTYEAKRANAGDIVRMQFIPKIPPDGTVNWTPSGGFMFGARTRARAEAIKKRAGLFPVLKMGEQVPTEDGNVLRQMIATGDLRAVPRCFGVADVLTWRAERVDYEIVG